MLALTEEEILENINALNSKLEDDEKKGILSDAEYKQCRINLQKAENSLRNMYIQKHLAKEKEAVEPDVTLLPFYDDESDSDMDIHVTRRKKIGFELN